MPLMNNWAGTVNLQVSLQMAFFGVGGGGGGGSGRDLLEGILKY